jgi:hypothetical protein
MSRPTRIHETAIVISLQPISTKRSGIYLWFNALPRTAIYCRKQASPGLVVRGSVRLVASVASQRNHFHGPELQPHDLARWRALRTQ